MFHTLTKHSWNYIIDLENKNKIKKRYCYEIQAFNKSFYFEIIEPKSDIINKYFLEKIINIAIEKTLLVSNMVFYIELINLPQYLLKLHLINIKLPTVFIIFYYST